MEKGDGVISLDDGDENRFGKNSVKFAFLDGKIEFRFFHLLEFRVVSSRG